MKNNNIKSTLHPAPASRSRGLKATLLLAAFAALAVMGSTHAGTCASDASVTIARLVYHSDLNGALGDYNLALAKANNEPTAVARTAARKLAAADYKDAVDNAKAQFQARRDLVEDLGEDRYNPAIDPANFVSPAEIAAHPNPLYPLIPGTTMNYRTVTATETTTTAITVTRETRVLLGVTCIVVRDTAKVNGALHEDTVDFFAQDRSGNVWYFGENTAEYVDGLINKIDGSWLAGVNGARPGIIMFAAPAVGKTYRQELLFTEAEDAAEIVALNESVTVPAGTYAHCLKTEEFTPIEPDALEFKYYAPGVGNVLTVDSRTGKRGELISVVKQ